MSRKLSLIFPIAGQGARFGYRFKPFLEVQGCSFIEAAVAPFLPWLARIEKVHFVFTREQDANHDVRARLSQMFSGVRHDTTVLDAPTNGPAETLVQCLETKAITGPVMICDCDHAVNVDGLMRAALEKPEIACAVPTWNLEGEPLTSWSVAAIGEDGRIAAVAEKALPEQGSVFRGVIGCYYFSDATRVRRLIREDRMIYLSDVVAKYIANGHGVFSVPVNDAHFFGDPARLARVATLNR